MDVAPKVQITGEMGAGGGGGSVFQALLTLLMADKLEVPVLDGTTAERQTTDLG